MKRKCGIDECNSSHSAKGICNRHYLIILRAGGFNNTAQYLNKNETLKDRLCAGMVINDETGCWDWSKAISQTIPKIRYQGKTQTAYRMSYEVFVGDIPKNMTIDHLCENRNCINPFHLEPVTFSENTRRYHENRRFEKQKNIY